MRQKVLFYTITVFLPLIVALVIYVLYRPDSTLVNQLFIGLFSTETLDSFRSLFSNKGVIKPYVIYSFPNALWIFSTTILSVKHSIHIFKWVLPLSITPVLYCLLLEMCQLLHLTNGTFDLIDVLTSIIFWALAIMCMKTIDWHSIRVSWMKPMVFFSYAILILSDTI